MRIAVSREKTLQLDGVCIFNIPQQNNAGDILFNQCYPAPDGGSHNQICEISFRVKQSAQFIPADTDQYAVLFRETVRQCMACGDQIELTCKLACMLRGNKGALIVFVKGIEFDGPLDDHEHVNLTLASTEDLSLCWDVFFSAVLAYA